MKNRAWNWDEFHEFHGMTCLGFFTFSTTRNGKIRFTHFTKHSRYLKWRYKYSPLYKLYVYGLCNGKSTPRRAWQEFLVYTWIFLVPDEENPDSWLGCSLKTQHLSPGTWTWWFVSHPKKSPFFMASIFRSDHHRWKGDLKTAFNLNFRQNASRQVIHWRFSFGFFMGKVQK